MASDFVTLRKTLKATFREGKTLPLSFRKQQLYKLYQCLQEHEQELLDAMEKDGKNRSEATLSDLLLITKEVSFALDHLDAWAAPESASIGWRFASTLDTAQMIPDPYGTVLIIGTWNYPVACLLGPLVGAIAAGNTAVLKVSEVSVHTSELLAKLLPKYLDNSCYKVVEGGVPEITALLRLQWDTICYTGNGTVGRIIAKAAAEHLTPCILELGGKSPAVIDRGVDLSTMAQRVVAGKFFNNGQTCIAPDYLLVPEEMQDEFIGKMREAVAKFYGDNVKESSSYARIVNGRHWKRLVDVLKASKGKVVIGGDVDEAQNYIAPTVVTGVKPDDALMKDEIFGPLLPVLTYKKFEEVFDLILSRDKPLAAYLYSVNQESIDTFKKQVSTGGMVINDSVVHFAYPLPFGGVGPSGYGTYHGKAGFDAFSHKKPVLWRSSGMEFVNNLRYPPYTEHKNNMLRTAMIPTPADPEVSRCTIA